MKPKKTNPRKHKEPTWQEMCKAVETLSKTPQPKPTTKKKNCTAWYNYNTHKIDFIPNTTKLNEKEVNDYLKYFFSETFGYRARRWQ